MRLDKFFTQTGTLSRSGATKAIKTGQVKVNNIIQKKADFKIDENKDTISLNDQVIKYQKYVYIMLNKPDGVVSATEDKKQKTALDLLPEKYQKLNLFPCGRLDKDTLGLMLLTNDGQTAHNLLSPKKHIKKTYFYRCIEPLSLKNKHKIELGITLKDGYTTKPCCIKLIDETSGEITLTEGKYHEIKRLFGAVGNKIIFLERISFGTLILDKSLARGTYRELNEEELEQLLASTI